mmetsp:Transcript_74187/g.204331  ORF Transcript_74187/g.204331 Transcript_74187/m.204331 type:complete len:317 (-) Transcript_74187:883-1833(-)
MDCLGHDIVGCRVAEAILGQLGVEATLVLLFEDVEPAAGPALGGRLLEQRGRVVERPVDELDLLRRRGLVLHPLGSDGERVEVGADWLDVGLGIGDEEAERVERVGEVVLVEHDRGHRVAAHRVQVHVHERRLGRAAGLPADDRRDVRAHDIRLLDEGLRRVDPERLGLVRADEVDGGVVDLELVARLAQHRVQLRHRDLARHHVTVEDLGARVARRLLDFGLVVVVVDLHERHETREPVLLGRLALDVEALADADAPEHLGDRVARARAVDDKPLRAAGGVGLQVGGTERARGSAVVAPLVKVGDELARVGLILL